VSRKVSKERLQLHKEIGFHLFEFSKGCCGCFEKPWHVANTRLKEMLVDFEYSYRTFEQVYFKKYHHHRSFLLSENRLNMVEEEAEISSDEEQTSFVKTERPGEESSLAEQV
jgi:Fe-S cluster biosynthesis and repair protein YggX